MQHIEKTPNLNKDQMLKLLLVGESVIKLKDKGE